MRATQPTAKKRVVKRPSTGDTKGAGEFRKATQFKKGKAYKRAVRVAYEEQPVPRRRAILKAAAERPSPEGVVVQKEHRKRAVRRRELEVSAATKDTKGAVDRTRGREESARNIKGSRIAYLRRTREPAVDIKAELEGRGKLAALLESVGTRAVKGTSAGRVQSSLGIDPSAEFGGRLAKDLVNLPAQVVPSLYVPAAGVVEAAQGRPQRIKKFAKDIQEGDPAYALGESAVALVKGDTGKASSSWGKAKRLASEHPGFALAEGYGIRGTAGRGAGRAMRAGIAGEKGKRAASTEREGRVVPGTKIEEKRSYSPDIITKQEQKLAEKMRRDRAQRIRDKAEKAKDPAERDRLLDRAERVEPTRLPEHAIERRVDERVDANETVRRANRAETVNEARKVVKKVRPRERPLVNLLSQGIVRADADDIKAYLGELEQEFKSLGPVGKRQNKALRRQIEKALDSKHLDLSKVEATAKRYQETVAPLEAHLVKHGLLDADQAEKARLIPYAVRRMGAKHEKDANGMSRIVGRDGDLLDIPQIRAHMKKHEQAEPAFLSQAPNARGARNFFVSSARAPSAGNAKRTGEATRKGTFDAHADTLVEQAARAQGLKDAHDGFGGFVDEFSLRHGPTGKARTFTTKAAALKAAERRMVDDDGEPIAGAHKFVPVRLNPFSGTKDQLAHLLDDVNTGSGGTGSGTQMSHKAIVDAIESAVKGEGDDAGPWALIPEAAAKRLEEHMRVLKPGEIGKIEQAVNSAFRRTVLATSPAWFMGNVTEGVARAALAKAGPRAYVTGRKVVKQIPEAERGDAMARMLPGGHYGSAERQRIHRDVSQFEGKRSEPVVRALSTFWRAPVAKHAADAWHSWTNLVFSSVNGRIETQIQTAMLGAELRRSPLMDNAGRKMGAKAIEQAAEGLRNTNEQVAFGRAVDKMYGKYGKWSPDMRKAIALYTPFVAWTLNATRFVVHTLPKDHPTTLAVIAASEQATEEWRKDHGLDKFMKGAVPGWMQGSVPGKQGEKFRLSRFTPFGLFGDPLATYSGAVLPQAQGVLNAMKGKDWKGDDLKDQSDAGRALAAVNAALGATTPLYETGKRIVKKGPHKFVTDAVTGRVEPPKKKVTRAKPKVGRIVGPGVGGGRIVGPGARSGRIVP